MWTIYIMCVTGLILEDSSFTHMVLLCRCCKICIHGGGCDMDVRKAANWRKGNKTVVSEIKVEFV